MNPAEEYEQRVRARDSQFAHFEKLHARLSNVRLGIFFAGIVMAWWSLHLSAFSGWWLTAPLALFVGVAVRHAGLRRARLRAERAVAFYKKGATSRK